VARVVVLARIDEIGLIWGMRELRAGFFIHEGFRCFPAAMDSSIPLN
jgi:hypothetical protein